MTDSLQLFLPKLCSYVKEYDTDHRVVRKPLPTATCILKVGDSAFFTKELYVRCFVYDCSDTNALADSKRGTSDIFIDAI